MVERKKTEESTAKPKKPVFPGLLLILIDSRTGSAGEAFAGFFQSEKKAVMVGEASLGRLMTSRYFAKEFGVDRIGVFTVCRSALPKWFCRMATKWKGRAFLLTLYATCWDRTCTTRTMCA